MMARSRLLNELSASLGVRTIQGANRRELGEIAKLIYDDYLEEYRNIGPWKTPF